MHFPPGNTSPKDPPLARKISDSSHSNNYLWSDAPAAQMSRIHVPLLRPLIDTIPIHALVLVVHRRLVGVNVDATS